MKTRALVFLQHFLEVCIAFFYRTNQVVVKNTHQDPDPSLTRYHPVLNL